VSYAEFDGMRSEIELLHDFMGWKLSSTDIATTEGLLSDVKLKTLPAASVPIATPGTVEVHIDPHWWAWQRDSKRSEIIERTFFRPVSTPRRPIVDHARVHERMRDLIAFIC
jgi:hypothetical protein